MVNGNTYRCKSCSDDRPDEERDFEKWDRMTDHAVDVHDGHAQFTLIAGSGGN